MLPEVTQENVHIFIPYKAAKIASALQKDRHMGLKQALLTFYASPAYRLLEKESTKLWHDSPAQIYAERFVPSPVKRSYQNGPYHSKLQPYASLIQTMHLSGASMKVIAAELAKYGLQTTSQNVWRFLKKH